MTRRLHQLRGLALLFGLASPLGACTTTGAGLIASWYVVPPPDREEPSPSPQVPPREPGLEPGIYVLLANAGAGAEPRTVYAVSVNAPPENTNDPGLLKGAPIAFHTGQMWLVATPLMGLSRDKCAIPVRLYVRVSPRKGELLGGKKPRVEPIEIEGKLPSSLPYDWRNHRCDPK